MVINYISLCQTTQSVNYRFSGLLETKAGEIRTKPTSYSNQIRHTIVSTQDKVMGWKGFNSHHNQLYPFTEESRRDGTALIVTKLTTEICQQHNLLPSETLPTVMVKVS